MIHAVTVYCASSDQVHPDYLDAARCMGAAIARRGLRLYYGAGSTGLMGAVADGALQAGGQVVGVIPEIFNTPQLAHRALSEIKVVATMHQRKAQLAELGDAFIVLPGGFGTFDEFFEILTWSQVGLHSKPIGLLNILDYFNPLFALVQHALGEGMIYKEHLDLYVQAEKPDVLLESLERFQHPSNLARWVNRDSPPDLAST